MAKKQDWIIGGIILLCLVFFIFSLIVFMAGISTQGNIELSGGGDRIAAVELRGIIQNPRDIVQQFERYRKDRSIKGIVFRIESPGGGVAAAQEIYEHVRKTRESGKVIIASMGSVAASGGYYVACGADTIMANPGTTTGSIGVIAEIPNTRKLMEKIGIEFTVIKSGKFKDTGSPFKEVTEEERKYLQGWIDDAFNQFVEVVSKERGMTKKEVLKYADGRVFTGQQAKEYHLIDLLGTYEDAIALTAKLAGIKGEPRIVKETRRRKLTIFDLLFQDVGELLDRFQSSPTIKYQLIW